MRFVAFFFVSLSDLSYFFLYSFFPRYEGDEFSTMVATYDTAVTKGSIIHRLAAKGASRCVGVIISSLLILSSQ